MFRATTCQSSRETTAFMRNLVPDIPDSHPHKITRTKCRINTVVCPDDGHIFAPNTYRKEINILRKIVHQVGFIYKSLRNFDSICYQRPVPPSLDRMVGNCKRSAYITIYKQHGSAARPNVWRIVLAKFKRSRGLDKCRVCQTDSRTRTSNAINSKCQNVPEPLLSTFHLRNLLPWDQSLNMLSVLKCEVSKGFLLKQYACSAGLCRLSYRLTSS